MQLLLYPDPRLRRLAAPVADFGAALDPVVDGVCAIMREAGAVGLTAPHCGVPLRLVVIQKPRDERRVFVNPVVAESSDAAAEHEEGSVSMPGVRATIARAARIRLTYQDGDGSLRESTFDGFDAAIMLHEIDQLDGIFWFERLSRLKRDRLVKRYEKLSRQG